MQPERSREDNIKTDVKHTRFKNVVWNNHDQDMDRWRALVYAVRTVGFHGSRMSSSLAQDVSFRRTAPRAVTVVNDAAYTAGATYDET